jgi:hypothetical protein
MKRGVFGTLVASCVVGALTAASAAVAMPQAMRVALALTTMFALSGFAALCAVLPERAFSVDEVIAASLGISLALSTGVAMALVALPVGLSRGSFAVVLGLGTLVLAASAGIRSQPRRPTLMPWERQQRG